MTRTVFRTLEEVRGRFAPCSLAIGNFDGVHVGHQVLINATVNAAGEKGLAPSILSFDPHPTAVVAPERRPQLICSLEERIHLLFARGVEQIFVLPFTPDIAAMSPREFVSQILVKSLQTKVVVVGENFLFGHRQAGNAPMLRALGSEFGFESQLLPPVIVRGEIVSSSAIRRHISLGDVSRAGRLLGRCFSVAGPVVSGRGVGSKQTVPTLNLRPVPGQVLPRGVFVTETLDQNT
ncbi:MAG: bifunctional riboflavin kinase/FMN adenylyltransferase, partial [Acidobacteriaceae bacterium]|nr:bifunctional riboflavin kinase/FMN adenylyltransferase [Acidobacteriaceae bacterium]